MANYKRKRPRTSGGQHTSVIFYRKRLGIKPVVPLRWENLGSWGSLEYLRKVRAIRNSWPSQFRMMRNWPKWFDVIEHNRPRRREDAAVAKAVLCGKIDPDEALWPLSRRPRSYYW